MADFYLDISAVGNEYQAYADTPATWGVPQDGNGKAGPGHAAAVAIATIDCTSAVGDGAQTLSILGVSVSNASAGSGATLAESLVTSINGTTTATTATYCQALLPLNKLVFARQKPDELAKVQVMMRIAGADWNGMDSTHAGFTTGPTISAFTGGADGPFAYLISPSNVFGKTAPAYGVLSAVKCPGTSEPGGSDWINTRTRRGGVDLSVDYVTASGGVISTVPGGGFRKLLFDDGTVWAGDNGQLTLALTNNSSGSGLAFSGSPNGTSGRYFLVGKSKTNYNFRLYVKTKYTPKVNISSSFSDQVFYFENVLIEEDPYTNANGGFEGYVVYATCIINYTRCKFLLKGSRILATIAANGQIKWQFLYCEVAYFGLTANATGLVSITPGNGASIDFIACRFYDTNGVYSVVNPLGSVASSSASYRLTFDSCTGITDVSSNSPARFWDGDRQLTWENFGPYRDWRIETGCWLAEWRNGQNFATLSALLPRSNTPWSIKTLLRNVGEKTFTHKIARLFGVHLDSTAARTVEVKFLAQRQFTSVELGLLVMYVDENDVVRYQSTLDGMLDSMNGTGANIQTSADIWTLNGQSGYAAYKLSLITAYPVKTNTDISGYVLWNGTLASDQTLFINPELLLS